MARILNVGFEFLADEASEALNGRSWSRQDCMEFHKKLDWELQAYDKVNSKLELSAIRKVDRVEQPSANEGSKHSSLSYKVNHGESLIGPQLQMEGVPETDEGKAMQFCNIYAEREAGRPLPHSAFSEAPR
jgi:hypothetical protein